MLVPIVEIIKRIKIGVKIKNNLLALRSMNVASSRSNLMMITTTNDVTVSATTFESNLALFM